MLKKPMVYLFGGLILFLLIGAGVLTVSKYMRYRSAGLQGLQTAPQPFVAIASPNAFSQIPAGSPIPVQVAAAGYRPLVSAELWIDGTLMGVQASLPGGQFQIDAAFLWNPGPAGEHTLVARTLDADGAAAVSAPLLVEILPPDGPFDPGPAEVLPPAPGEEPPPGPPGPGESVGPAQAGPPSPADWLSDQSANGAPAAPDLSIEVQGCGVSLNIHDLSDDEAGFQVFRSLAGAPGWIEIAVLASQSALDWLTYPDDLSGLGDASYYVAAVNAAGAAQSNPAVADVSLADCAGAGQQVLLVNPVGLHIDAPVDQAYCYRSLGGLSWQRWPATGFFLPGPDGFQVQDASLVFALNGLEGEPVIDKLDLYLECWGWAGGQLLDLGPVHFGSTDLLDLGELSEQGELYTMDLEFQLDILSLLDLDTLYNFLGPVEQAQLPFVVAWLTYDQDQCVAHLPKQFQNALGATLFCAPYPGFTIGPGTANPQPYVVWTTLDHTCPAGFNLECRSLAFLLNYAESHNGEVSFGIDDLMPSSLELLTGRPGEFSVYVVPPPQGGCKPNHTVSVQLLYDDDLGFFAGPYSSPVPVPCGAPLGDSVGLNVTFETLTLSSVDDGESAPQDVELFGYFQAYSSDGSIGLRDLGYWYDSDRDYYGCPDEAFHFAGSLNTMGTGGCPLSFKNGEYPIAQLGLCTSDYVESCVINYSQQTDFIQYNNTIHLTVGEGQGLALLVSLVDYDSASGNDVVCFTGLNIGPKTVFQWANTVDEPFAMSQPNNGNSACTIQGTISVGP
jgi:hypothetical protein